ncbi:MAG: AI-2E family transporter [Rubrobacteraceae bacterium]
MSDKPENEKKIELENEPDKQVVEGETGEPPVEEEAIPTAIPVSRRSIAVIGVILLALFALILYAVPSVLVIMLGGIALAIVLSFPVRGLSHFMPRGLAILLTTLGLLGSVVIAFAVLGPLLVEQLGSFVVALPSIANSIEQFLRATLEPLADRGILQGTPDEFMSQLGDNLSDRLQTLAENLLSGLGGFISSALGFAVGLFAAVFIAIYLLIDIRKVEAAYLRLVPDHYRRDAEQLWNDFGVSLSRYLGGLLIVVVIQGALTTLALFLLDVPYALLLGAWVSATAIIPYLGAFLGAIPAVILALFESPTTAVLTIIFYVGIQQLESNLLTPRIQGQALHVHPILVLLTVIAAGQLAGLLGIIFAVPVLAVLRVLLDFFGARLVPREQNQQQSRSP